MSHENHGTGGGSEQFMEGVKALAEAVQDVKKVIMLGQLSDLDPLRSNKMPIVLKSVLALPECSSAEAATHAQLPVISAKSMAEHANDEQVRHQHSTEEHCLAPKITTETMADSHAWRASNPTALDKGMAENDYDQPVLHEHSAHEDGTAPKIATGKDTDSLACGSGLEKSKTQFPDAPWRKNTSPVSEPSRTKFPDAPWRKKTCPVSEPPQTKFPDAPWRKKKLLR